MADSGGGAKNQATETEFEEIKHQIENIVKEIAENEDPCSIFQENLHILYRASRKDVINLLKQLNIKTASKLKEQLFHRFTQNFQKDTLSENGFHLTETDLISHLKVRKNQALLCNDIYNLGLSIFEDTITVKLASDILKPPYIQYPAVIDSQSAQILEKLQALILSSEKLHKDNKELKDHVSKLEQKAVETNKLVEELKEELNNLKTTKLERIQQSSNTPKHEKLPTAKPQPINDQPTHHPLDGPTPYTPAPKTYSQIMSDLPVDASILESPNYPKSDQSKSKSPPPRKNIIFGGKKTSKTQTPVIGNPKPFSLFVGGFHPNLNINDIKKTIEKEVGISVIGVELNKANHYNKSVKVDINFRDKAKALNESAWLEGLIVKPYRRRRTPRTVDNHQGHRHQLSENNRYTNYQNWTSNQEQYTRNHSNHWDTFNDDL